MNYMSVCYIHVFLRGYSISHEAHTYACFSPIAMATGWLLVGDIRVII